MDTTTTLWGLRSLMWDTNRKYKHFDKLYNDIIKEYHKVELSLKSAKAYIKEYDGQENNKIYKMSKDDIRQYTKKLKFAQDEIRMYKNEMHKWRDISTKLERAYWSTYHKLEKVWQVSEDGNFGSWRGKRFIGADTKLHLRITGYDCVSWHHQISVALIDPQFGVLTNEHMY